MAQIRTASSPLCRCLVDHYCRTFWSLYTSAGINTIRFVVGYESERVIEQAKKLIPPHITALFVVNRDWQKQNGISLLAAAGHVNAPFLLTMGDHVFDDSIIDCLLQNFEPGLLNIAIDRKLHSIVDLDDAMKVQTRGDKVTGIGKNLRSYDAIDTGLFVCPSEIFAYLEQAKSNNGGNDCSLANGVELMAVDGKVRGIDIGSAAVARHRYSESFATRRARHELARTAFG